MWHRTLAVLAVAGAAYVGYRVATPAQEQRESEPEPGGRLCVRVVDGDTIVLDGGERVRYIGIDTPETKHPSKPVQWMGREASAANRRLVEGRRVRLEYDVERKDRYGRTLAYVWVGHVMVNERLVRAGYAKVSTYPPNVKHTDRFLRAQRKAKEAGRGLWGDGATPANDPILAVDDGQLNVEDDSTPPSSGRTVYITRTGERFHRGGCRYLRRSRIPCVLKDAIARGLAPCRVCRP